MENKEQNTKEQNTNENLLGDYRLVLGLEIHMHLKTKTKMFCRCPADYYESEPNTHACPTCLGLPGALPVPNEEAVKKTQLFGLAMNCRLNEDSRFDRKHYSYPDLPKGYQISQYLQPLCENGYLELSSGEKADIQRIHLEEDTAKSIHKGNSTLVDFNKSGMPLVETVTEPTFKSIADAVEFCKKMQDIARILDISDADMEKGQMRLEANISLRTAEQERKEKMPNYKVEIKNINSFKFMEKAVKAEIKRQKTMLDEGKELIQENRGFDENANVTVPQRTKEDAHDYRYFPEPDIPPMNFSESYFEELEALLPELPHQIRERLVTQYNLSEKNAEFLSFGPGLELLEQFESYSAQNIEPEKVANLIINRIEFRDLEPEDFAKKLEDQEDKIDSGDELKTIISKVLSENGDAFEKYKAGNDNTMQFLIGQVMKATKGKADANAARKIIQEEAK